jgi:hypothetical protein
MSGDLGGQCLEYNDRSVEQGSDDRDASSLQLPSVGGEAVGCVARTHAVAFLQLICSAFDSSYKNCRLFSSKVACRLESTLGSYDILLTGSVLRR